MPNKLDKNINKNSEAIQSELSHHSISTIIPQALCKVPQQLEIWNPKIVLQKGFIVCETMMGIPTTK
jgi:hypothetical protein